MTPIHSNGASRKKVTQKIPGPLVTSERRIWPLRVSCSPNLTSPLVIEDQQSRRRQIRHSFSADVEALRADFHVHRFGGQCLLTGAQYVMRFGADVDELLDLHAQPIFPTRFRGR